MAKSKIANDLFPSGITIDKKEGVGTPLNPPEMGLHDPRAFGFRNFENYRLRVRALCA